MTNRIPSKRPTCEEILETKQKWALNDTESYIENEIKILLEEKLEEKLFIYSILESKLIAIKVKMINESETFDLKELFPRVNEQDFIRKFLGHLKVNEIINHEQRINVIDSIVDLMRNYLKFIEIQENALNAIASLFLENDSTEALNPEQIERVIEATLIAMELYPNQHQLQKNALIILYSKQIIENLQFKCVKLAMDSMVNFKKTDMNLMASVISATHLMNLSIKERSDLGSNKIYIETLLDIIKSRVNFQTYYYLIENTLSVLVNFLVDSLNNCSIFTELEGIEVCFILLEVR